MTFKNVTFSCFFYLLLIYLGLVLLFLDLEESGIGLLKGTVNFCSLNLKRKNAKSSFSFTSSLLWSLLFLLSPAPVLSRPCARPPAYSKGSQVSFEDIFVLSFFLCCFRCVQKTHQGKYLELDVEFLYMVKATFYRTNATIL